MTAPETPATRLEPVGWRDGWRLTATPNRPGAGAAFTVGTWTLHVVSTTGTPPTGHVRTIPAAVVDGDALGFYRWLANTLKAVGALEAARDLTVAGVALTNGGDVVDDRRLARAVAHIAAGRAHDRRVEHDAADNAPTTSHPSVTPIEDQHPDNTPKELPLWQ